MEYLLIGEVFSSIERLRAPYWAPLLFYPVRLISVYMESVIFVTGLALGSFANVCIYRIPKDLSIFKPSSFCPKCNTHIKWYDNIPIISFILLLGRCRNCRGKISLTYPFVEILTATIFLLVYKKITSIDSSFLSSALYFLHLIPYFVFVWILIVVSVIDYKHRIIPDIFSLLLIVVGMFYSPVNFFLGEKLLPRLLNASCGCFGGIFLGIAVSYIGEKIFKKEAFGGGDIKLLSGIGAFLGIKNIFWTLFYSSLIGSIFSIVLIVLGKIKKNDYIPFGPFLSIAAILLFLLKL